MCNNLHYWGGDQSLPDDVTVLFYTFPNFQNTSEPWFIEAIYFDANMFLMSLLLAIMTYNEIEAAVLVLFWVMFPLAFRDRTMRLFGLTYNSMY